MAHYTRYTSEHYDPRRGPRAASAAPRRRRWVAVLRYLGLVLVAALCMTAGTAWGWLQKTAAQLQKDPIVVKQTEPYLHPTTEGQPVNILLIGNDRRADARDAGDKGRSDTMLLLRIDPQARTVSMLSVPRDLWVDIPGHGQERVNVAYTWGGDALTVRMFEQLTGLPSTTSSTSTSLASSTSSTSWAASTWMWIAATTTGSTRALWTSTCSRAISGLTVTRPSGSCASATTPRVTSPAWSGSRSSCTKWSGRASPGASRSFPGSSRRSPRTLSPTSGWELPLTEARQLFGLAKTMLGLNTSRVYQAHVTGVPFTTTGGARSFRPTPSR